MAALKDLIENSRYDPLVAIQYTAEVKKGIFIVNDLITNSVTRN